MDDDESTLLVPPARTAPQEEGQGEATGGDKPREKQVEAAQAAADPDAGCAAPSGEISGVPRGESGDNSATAGRKRKRFVPQDQ